MKNSILLFAFLFTIFSFSQEKKLWAKSFINQEAPKLIVEKWLTVEPDTKGKFVLIDFWATWCGPCKRAIPDLNTFHKEFKKDLVVIGLSDEVEGKVLRQNNPKIDYYSAIDTKKRLKNTYKVQGIPHCVIVNPQGIVVWEGWPNLEGFELTSEAIKKLIKEN